MMMSGKKRRSMMMMEEGLPHDVVELILERLPVRSLLRFKSVSKQWKSTMESRSFQERQLKQQQQRGRGDPDVLMVSSSIDGSLRTLELGSSSSVKIPTPWYKEGEKTTRQFLVSNNSCDGLVCLYDLFDSGYVANPATRWFHPLPLSQLQQHIISQGASYFTTEHVLLDSSSLGFGKDNITSTYKPVWLYNSSELGSDNDNAAATRCEVFDFSTNAWRYVTPSAPYRVVGEAGPVFVHGSLHWFTDCVETKILSFDLHTEAFQVISKAPFPANSHNHDYNPYAMVLCNLDDRLCVSQMNDSLSDQVIWSFNSGNKTWDKIFSIDLDLACFLYGCSTEWAFRPLALLDRNKDKNLLFYDGWTSQHLLIHDPDTYPDDFIFRAKTMGFVVCYFQSLISI